MNMDKEQVLRFINRHNQHIQDAPGELDVYLMASYVEGLIKMACMLGIFSHTEGRAVESQLETLKQDRLKELRQGSK